MANSSILHDPDDLATDPRRGHTTGELGPSDNSDSGSDTAGLAGRQSDTDSQGTGERASVDPDVDADHAADLIPDTVVDEERVARSRPGDDQDDATDPETTSRP